MGILVPIINSSATGALRHRSLHALAATMAEECADVNKSELARWILFDMMTI